jgi:cysteine desulfurase
MFDELGVDTLSLSAHKLGGPKGVGALVLKDGLDIAPLVIGGGQERRRRAGTENVIGIAGFGAAASAAKQDLADMSRIAELRGRLEREALELAPGARVIGAEAPRLPNTTCLALPGMAAETLVIRFDLAGIAISAGAACSSGKVGASTVLAAMGLPDEVARSAIRVSLGWTTTEQDIAAFLAAWSAIAGNQQQHRAVA